MNAKATHISTHAISHDVWLWLGWVAMTTLGWFVGNWVGFILGGLLLAETMLLTCTSAGVGLMQWIVLSRTMPTLAQRWRWWVPASIVGMAVPVLLYALIWQTLFFGLRWQPAIALGGGLVGLLQQRILRRASTRSAWWAPTCLAGWALAILASFLLFPMIQLVPMLSFLSGVFLGPILQGLILALVTGSVLVWMLRSPAEQVEPSAERHLTIPVPASVRRWLGWVAMTTLGWFFGSLVGFLTGIMLLSPDTIAIGAVVGASAGIGLMQWSVLSAADAAHNSYWRWWVPAAVVGMTVPLVTGLFMIPASSLSPGPATSPLDPLFALSGWWVVAIALGGGLAGLLQQRMLRHACARSWWWAPTCLAGWVLAVLAFLGFGQVLMSPPFSPVMFLVELILPGLILALVTGSVLVGLWRAPAPAAPPDTSSIPSPPRSPVPVAPSGTSRKTMVQALAVTAGLIVVLVVLPQLTFMIPAGAQYKETGDAQSPRGIAFSPDGTRIATTLPDKGGVLIDLASGRAIQTFPRAFAKGGMLDVAFSPDGALLATTDAPWDIIGNDPVPGAGALRLWDPSSGAEVRELLGDGVRAGRVVFSPDGRLLAVAATAGPFGRWVNGVRLLDVATGAEVRSFGELDSAVQDLAFSPDGRLLVTTMASYWSPDAASTLRLWEVATGRQLWGLQEPEGSQVVSFSPDGRLLATNAFVDGSVTLRDVATGTEVYTLAALPQVA